MIGRTKGSRGALATRLALFVLLSASPAAADEVTLKNGTKLVGEVTSLIGGKLKVKVGADEVTVTWSEVADVSIDRPLPIELGEEKLEGSVATQGGAASVRLADGSTRAVDLAEFTSINKPVKPDFTYKGNAALGATITNGNTQTKTANANSELEGRYLDHRVTLRGQWNYAEDEDSVTARNARGTVKYDYFVTKRLYVYAGGGLEGDSEADLKLRWTVSAGPGYQAIEPGDFESEWVAKLDLRVEAGIAYVKEDFDGTDDDDDYVAARWGVKLDWPLNDRVTLFHVHNGVPSLEDKDDLLIYTEQGARFTIFDNFFAAVQVNWVFDNTPAEDKTRADTIYLFSLGYSFGS